MSLFTTTYSKQAGMSKKEAIMIFTVRVSLINGHSRPNNNSASPWTWVRMNILN